MAKIPDTPRKMAKTAKKVASPNSASKKGGPKQVQRGIVQVIKSNKFKPVASPTKKSTYRKLDTVLRSKKASAGKTGNARIEARAEGNLRGLSVLRKDAAIARRGGSMPAKKGVTAKKPIPKNGGSVGPIPANPIKVRAEIAGAAPSLTSVGGRMFPKNWSGTGKVNPKQTIFSNVSLNNKTKKKTKSAPPVSRGVRGKLGSVVKKGSR